MASITANAYPMQFKKSWGLCTPSMLTYYWELLEMLPSARELAALEAAVFRRKKSRRRDAGLRASLRVALPESLLV